MPDQRALIVIGHGSRREAANQEFEAYVEKLAHADQSRTMPLYDYVGAAFLEFASPTLLQASDNALALGFSTIDIYPVFLTRGNHVGNDVPQQVAQVTQKHSTAKLRLLDYLGSSPSLPEWLLDHVSEQQTQLEEHPTETTLEETRL